MDISQSILSDITVYMKYAKFNPEVQRRETWKELVDRNKAMHLKKFPQLQEETGDACQTFEGGGGALSHYRNTPGHLCQHPHGPSPPYNQRAERLAANSSIR
jgi:hypothetical protein